MAFQDWLKKAREDAGLTQKAAAATARVSRHQWGMWERGGFVPRVRVVPQIAEALGVDVQEVMSRAHPGRGGGTPGKINILVPTQTLVIVQFDEADTPRNYVLNPPRELALPGGLLLRFSAIDS